MDPLSISASIAALLGIATQIATTGYRIGKKLAGAEEEVLRLTAEITGLVGVLHSLQFMISQFEGQENTGAIESYPIQSCFATLFKIKQTLTECDPNSAPNGSKSLGSIKRRLRWPLRVQETKELIDEVGRHKATLGLAVNVDGMTALLRSLTMQHNLVEQVSEIQASVNTARKSKISTSLSKKRRAILDSFGKIDPQKAQDMAIKLRHPGTAGWFIDGEDFKKWLEGDCTRLWLCGIPGAGKTILTSAIIMEAQKIENEANGLAYFYCDYKSLETLVPINIIHSLIKQLAMQNKEAFQEIETFWEQYTSETVQATFEIEEESVKTTSGLRGRPLDDRPKTYGFQSESLAVELLQRMSSHFDRVMVIVDGLDECGEQTIASTRLLSVLADSELGRVKTLLTSREVHEIGFELSEHKKLWIAAKSSDIRLYVESEIAIRIQQKQLRLRHGALEEGAFKDFMTEKLIEKADGMFQWVKCQLDHLCQLPNDSARRKALDILPPTLPSIYERILARVNEKDETVQDLVEKVLRWIVCGNVPLNSAQIAEIASVEIGDTRISAEAITTDEEILLQCSSLIRKNPNGNIELSHFSVREFLMGIPEDPKISPFTRYRIDLKLDNMKSAAECLQYLCMEDFATGCLYDADSYFRRRKEHPFLSYAATQWDSHARYDPCHTDLLELMCSLFKPEKSLQFLSWIQEKVLLDLLLPEDFASGNGFGALADSLNEIAEQLNEVSKIHVATSIHLPSVVSWLVEQGYDVNKQSQLVGTPLIIATSCPVILQSNLGEEFSYIQGVDNDVWRLKSRLDTIEVLLHAGADPNIPGPDGFTALQQMLRLEPDFDESKQTFCETHLKIIQVLCKAGAVCTKEVLEDYFHGVLLQKFPGNSFSISGLLPDDKLHIQKGIAPLVERIMREIDGVGQTEDHKSGLPLSNEAYGRMLREAAGLGEIEALRKYFDENRSIDLRDDWMRTALHIAALRGRLDAVEFLIQHQADPKACDIDGNTPLHLACFEDRKETIHYLWSYSEIKNSHGESPLMLAAAHCSSSTLKSLLARASQEAINERAANGYSMLHFAAAARNVLNVTHLIDNGLDVGAVSNDMLTPIMAAIEGDDNSDASDQGKPLELILRTLIEHGADSTLDTRDDRGQTALHILCRCASGDEGEQAAKVLLEHGASCEITDTEQNTALDEALQAGCENASIVNLLLSKHPDLNQQDDWGQTILHRIFGVRRPSDFDMIARSAIERKGDLSIRDHEGMTVLVSAFHSGQRTNILKVLLSDVPDEDLSKHNFEGHGLLNLSMKCALHTDLIGTILDRSENSNSVDNHSWNGNILRAACAFYPNPKIMRRILSLCDNLSIQDDLGRSPLFIAAQKGNCWMVSELIAAKVNVESRGSPRPLNRIRAKNLTPLLATAYNREKRVHRDCAELLVEAGADLEARDSNGRGLIAYISKIGDEEALRYFSTTKIDFASVFPRVLSGDKINYTALHLVAEKGHLECLRILLKTGAFSSVDVAPQHGVTPLLIAAKFDMLEICKVLCNTGANVNIIDTRNGNSPLHEAAIIGSKPIALFLLQQGVDVALQNNASFTAEYEALARGHNEIAEILKAKASSINEACGPPLTGAVKVVPQPPRVKGLQDCRHTPDSLYHSIEVGATRFWRQFLAEKLDINVPACTHGAEDGSVCFPLNVALSMKNEDLVELFLEHNADIHHTACTLEKSMTPLELCALWNNMGLMRLVLSEYEVPVSKTSLNSLAKAIGVAAAQGNLLCLEELCRYGRGGEYTGKDPRFAYEMNRFRVPALCQAAKAIQHQEKSIRLLLQHGSDINDVDGDRSSALHIAARSGNCSVIQILVDNGAHIHARSKFMQTPILVAAQNSHLDAVRLLYKLGGCLEDRDGNGNSLLSYSVSAKPATGIPMLAWLTASMPWELHFNPIGGNSLLNQAIYFSDNDFTSVSYLIDNGADILHQNHFSGSVIHAAAQIGSTWLTMRLLQLIPMEKIVEMLDYPSGLLGTPLFAASGQGHVRVVEVLLDAGASIDAWNTVYSSTSGTALMIACINGREDVVRLLLSRGARMTVFNSDGLEISALKVTHALCGRTLRVLHEWEAATTNRCSYFGY